MIKLTNVYSNGRTLKMKQNKLRAKKIKVGLMDLLYVAFFFLIIGSTLANLHLERALNRASLAIAQAQASTIIEKEIVEVKVAREDDRVSTLKSFLKSKNSPLAAYSQLIIEQSDKYAVDWTQIVSLAGMESKFCTYGPAIARNNCWGWGGSNRMSFATMEEGIAFSAKTLGQSYRQNANQGIKSKYCPESDGCNPHWAAIVTKSSNEILALKGGK